MKISKLLIAFGAFTATLLAALAVTNGSAFAATKTWNGSIDINWNTAGNWTPSGAPVNGDDLVFSTTSTPTSGGVNNISGLIVNTISIDNSANVMWSVSTAVPMSVTTSVISTGAESSFLGGFTLNGDVELRDIDVNDYSTGSPLNQIQLNGHDLSYNSVNNAIGTLGEVPITGTGNVSYSLNNTPFHVEAANTYTGGTNVSGATYISNQGTGITMNDIFGNSTANIAGDSALLLMPSSGDTAFNTQISFQGIATIDALFDDQLIISDGLYSGPVTIPNITLLGNIRATAYDGISTIDLAGITSNGFCMQYGGEMNLDAAKFLNGPSACVLAANTTNSNAPKVPNTGFELLKNNPIATLLTTTAAATIIIAIAKKRASLKA